MKPASAKAKGRRLQDHVVARLRETHPTLEADDIKPAIMGERGVDIKLSPAARRLIPWSIECKNTQRLNIWSALAPATGNVTDGTRPAVVFSRNRTEVFIAVRLDDFLAAVAR